MARYKNAMPICSSAKCVELGYISIGLHMFRKKERRRAQVRIASEHSVFILPPCIKIATSVLKLNFVESKHCPRRLQYLRLDLRLQTPRGLRPGFIFSAKSHPPDPPPHWPPAKTKKPWLRRPTRRRSLSYVL